MSPSAECAFGDRDVSSSTLRMPDRGNVRELDGPVFQAGGSVIVRSAVGREGPLRYPGTESAEEHPVNFDEIKNKASELLEQNHEKVDEGIDKVAGFAAEKFGHEDQVKSVAEKAKDFLPGGE